MRWPQRAEGLRLLAGAELGYAPETPTAEAVGLAEGSDVGGLAWDVVASAMDVLPGHSIGVNYGRTGAGWLLSPQFRPNDELFELHYLWRPPGSFFLDSRVRWRRDLEKLAALPERRSQCDYSIRGTWRFALR